MTQNNDDKEAILKRLRRIEGQIKGIQKMIENDKSCVDILVQIAAARAAINKVGGIMLENHSKRCLSQAKENDNCDEKIGELIETVIKFMN